MQAIKQSDDTPLIVGSGIVGMSVALSLARYGINCRIIVDTAVPLKRHMVLFDQSLRLLQDMGIKIKPLMSLHHLHLSCKGHVGHRINHPNPLGHTVDGCTLHKQLHQAIHTSDHIEPIKGRLHDVKPTIDRYQIYIKTPVHMSELQTSMLIGADGQHSTVKNICAIDTKDFKQLHLESFDVNHQRFDPPCAMIRYIDNGLVAMVPITNQQSKCIITKIDDAKPSSMSMQELAKQLGHRYSNIQTIGEHNTLTFRPQITSHLYHAHEHRESAVCLIGNAALSLPPIGAQHFNRMLVDADILAKAILNTQKPIDAASYYQTICQPAHRQLMIHGQQALDLIHASAWRKRSVSAMLVIMGILCQRNMINVGQQIQQWPLTRLTNWLLKS